MSDAEPDWSAPATKGDLARVETRLEARIEVVEARLEGRIDVKIARLMWIMVAGDVGTVLALGGMILARG